MALTAVSNERPGIAGRILYCVLTLFALVSALPIIGMIWGTAIWNSINVPVGVYLVLASVSAFGLLIGMISSFLNCRRLDWITCISGTVLASLSFLFGYANYWQERAQPLVLGTFRFGKVEGPLIVFHAAAFILCGLVASLFYRKLSRIQPR